MAQLLVDAPSKREFCIIVVACYVLDYLGARAASMLWKLFKKRSSRNLLPCVSFTREAVLPNAIQLGGFTEASQELFGVRVTVIPDGSMACAMHKLGRWRSDKEFRWARTAAIVKGLHAAIVDLDPPPCYPLPPTNYI